MKRVILIIAAFMLMNATHATVRTLSNNANGGAQFSDINTCYAACSNGDTILIEGTSTIYSWNSSITFAKQLVFIGAGFKPAKQIPALSTIGGNVSSLGIPLNGGANGSKFYGIEFNGTGNVNLSGVNNITFEDCKFVNQLNSSTTVTNLTCRNCVFTVTTRNVVFAANYTAAFYSCVFSGLVDGNFLATAGPVTIDHCIFSNSSGHFTGSVTNTIVQNCIFMNSFPANTINTSFNNNICSVAGTFPHSGTGNSASGNIENTNPNFVSYTNGQAYSSAHDYHLQAGSAAIGSGTGGSDMGVHGGGTFFSEKGEPLITPVVRVVNVTNPNAVPNGTINVQINATKPNDN